VSYKRILWVGSARQLFKGAGKKGQAHISKSAPRVPKAVFYKEKKLCQEKEVKGIQKNPSPWERRLNTSDREVRTRESFTEVVGPCLPDAS